MARVCIALIIAAFAISACSGEGDPLDATQDAGRSYDVNFRDVSIGDVADATSIAEGAELYLLHCAGCHGRIGEGLTGPPLSEWLESRGNLAARIDATMPEANPAACEGECAERVADYILAELQLASVSCDEESIGPRQLRLLTRREYNNSVRDLLRLGDRCAPGSPCGAACNKVSFVYHPGDREPATVHVAGTFNDWAGTIDAGGWPMERDATTGLWRTTPTVENGRHLYKFVVDESDWFPDPSHPLREPDGFGGDNSILVVDCDGSGESSTFAPAAGFPPEVRPEGYGFDNHVDSGRVGAIHVAEYLDAGESLAALALEQRDEIIACNPDTDRSGCTSHFVESFGLRAFRRPLTGEETTRYEALLSAESEFDDGLALVVEAMLSSPHFLYRTELGEDAGNGTYRLTDYEVASLLSYTFWGTMPDDELFAAAAAGELSTPEELAGQSRRLLRDDRAKDIIGVWALQWLGVESVASANKNPDLFPGFDDATRRSLLEETSRFVNHVIFESSGTYGELLTADYTVADEIAAELYELENPDADGVIAYGEQRSGVFGHGSVLAAYAHSDQSSPIRRGLFVRRNLLCQEFGAPPPDAGGVPEVDPDATTRERFRQHTDNEVCASCHQYIDEIGFGFERFDAVGQYRVTENGTPIEAGGNMNDVEGFGTGTDGTFATLPELAQIVAESTAAKACFVRQYYRFAHGYMESTGDLCALDEVGLTFEESGYDIIEMMVAVTQTSNFTLRR